MSYSAQHTDADQLQSDEAAAQKLWRMIGGRAATYRSISACRKAIAAIDGLKSAVDSVDEANEANQYLICMSPNTTLFSSLTSFSSVGYFYDQFSGADKGSRVHAASAPAVVLGGCMQSQSLIPIQGADVLDVLSSCARFLGSTGYRNQKGRGWRDHIPDLADTEYNASRHPCSSRES